MVLSPGTSSVVMMNSSPAHQLDGALGEGLQADLGALEVGEDADGPAGLLAAALRTRSYRPWCSAWVPWLKLKRATFMPASISDYELFVGVDGGAEGADDFGTAHGAILSVCFAAEYSVWWK